MKILLASNSYPTPDNPMQAFIGVLCRELVRQGHEVTVLAPSMVLSNLKHGIKVDRCHYYDEFESDGKKLKVEIYRPHVYAPGEGRLTKLVSWICQKVLGRTALMMGKQFDVAYGHFWSSGLHLLDYVKRTKTPLIVASGEDKINIRYLRKQANIDALARLTKGVICVSSKNRDESVSAGLTIDNKCVVLPNATDSTYFYPMDKESVRRELGYPMGAFIVAFLGRFQERKGANRVLSAINLCNDKDIKAIFIGRKSTGDTFEAEGDAVLHLGLLPHEDVAKYLNAADVFVLPTLAEGCSNAIVEAMACGLPIISSDLPFNYDILNKDNAILVDPMNVDQIADGIKKLKEDKLLREKMSAASLRVAGELTIEKRVKKIVSFIEQKLK